MVEGGFSPVTAWRGTPTSRLRWRFTPPDSTVEGVGDYWWGDPAARHPFPGANHGPFYTVFTRLVIIGPDNKEQYRCARIAWLTQQPERQFFISESQIADWKQGWGC
jgi:hypothetical protein